MKFETPELSKVSNLDPAFTATVIEASGELYYSDTTLRPVSNYVKANIIIITHTLWSVIF